MAYGAFGQRRQESGWSGNLTSADWIGVASTTRRGYTFHETLDNLTFTHMNGRVYDQVTGRFLSPDPLVQAPGFTQSFNRYAYVFNNPLSYTDPSGYETKSADGDDGAADTAGAFVIGGPYGALAQLVRLWMGYGESPSEEIRRKSLAEVVQQVPQFDSVQVPRTVNTEAADASAADTVANPKGVKGWDPRTVGGTVDWAKVRDTLADGWDDFQYNVKCTWTCQWPGDGGLQAVLVALPELPGGALEQGGTRIYTSGASWAGSALTKAIYLPAWRKVSVNMAHIADRHIVGGESLAMRTEGTFFPSTMNEASVLRAIRDAYESSMKIGVQGTDRILLIGEGAGLRIEMWFNKVTKTIETAYPVVQ